MNGRRSPGSPAPRSPAPRSPAATSRCASPDPRDNIALCPRQIPRPYTTDSITDTATLRCTGNRSPLCDSPVVADQSKEAQTGTTSPGSVSPSCRSSPTFPFHSTDPAASLPRSPLLSPQGGYQCGSGMSLAYDLSSGGALRASCVRSPRRERQSPSDPLRFRTEPAVYNPGVRLVRPHHRPPPPAGPRPRLTSFSVADILDPGKFTVHRKATDDPAVWHPWAGGRRLPSLPPHQRERPPYLNDDDRSDTDGGDTTLGEYHIHHYYLTPLSSL